MITSEYALRDIYRMYRDIMVTTIISSPIFIPRKHTKESYRSQQRKAKKRR